MYLAKRVFLILCMLTLVAGFANAKDDEYAKIKALVSKQLGKKVTEIKPSPLPGLYQVTAPPMVFYMSKDARYVINGDIVDLRNRKNLSAHERAAAKLAAINQISEKDMIIYKPKKVKHVVTVFTDIDCAYCRKLHSEIAQYNKLGIEIRYLAFPRAGIGSASYNKAVSVWCAKDRKKAITNAKRGLPIAIKTCDNPVAKEYKLGEELGVNGTPTLVLEDGQIFPGYAPPDRLSAALDQMHPNVSMR
jgi:thiol:disulfide interchange protein DsbC